MVSLWPWRRDDSSPASFEKILSALATKIATTQAKLDKTRSSSRRVRFISTLYLSFGYLVYAIVLILVVGRKNLGSWEWTGLAGGPVGIYTLRLILNTYFTFRIDSLTAKLKDQQTERAKIIQKLKDATKYDSTQQLLEKYGGAETPKAEGKEDGRPGSSTGTPHPQDMSPSVKGKRGDRVPMAPPPTANIPRPGVAPPNASPGQLGPVAPSPNVQRPVSSGHSAEFAPNAFEFPGGAAPAQFASNTDLAMGGDGPHWYDRIMDMLLGEDETAAKNRFVLICKRCRLINGQAPPGTKSLSEVGTWKCMGCGSLNGEMDEGKRIVQEVLGEQAPAKTAAQNDSDTDSIVKSGKQTPQ